MNRIFDDRERAIEATFAQSEELRFLIRRRAFQTLAAWVAECMSLDADAAKAYESGIVDLLGDGWPNERLLESAQTDLERAGKPTLSMEVGRVFSQALTQADAFMRGSTGKNAEIGKNAEPNLDALDPWGQRHTVTEPRLSMYRL